MFHSLFISIMINTVSTFSILLTHLTLMNKLFRFLTMFYLSSPEHSHFYRRFFSTITNLLRSKQIQRNYTKNNLIYGMIIPARHTIKKNTETQRFTNVAMETRVGLVKFHRLLTLMLLSCACIREGCATFW